ncbi:MAG: hypothetical protein MZU84_03280 [Sphingobacterium sp.]|nr:hypothetical protein [Sphingobacterium sp.]
MPTSPSSTDSSPRSPDGGRFFPTTSSSRANRSRLLGDRCCARCCALGLGIMPWSLDRSGSVSPASSNSARRPTGDSTALARV